MHPPPHDWAQLIKPNRVHGSLYHDPAIFAAELAQIWFRTWVYVDHESEIARPHDFIMKSIGPQPVLMTRDGSGRVHLLLNRCPHRGNAICVEQRGNRPTFTCPFHAWSFGSDGALRAVAFPDGYDRLDRTALGLGHVPRVASYHGFVFGSFAPAGPSLADTLGGAAETIGWSRSRPQVKSNSPPASCGTGSRRTGSSCSKMKPTAATRRSCIHRSSASPTAASACSTPAIRKP